MTEVAAPTTNVVTSKTGASAGQADPTTNVVSDAPNPNMTGEEAVAWLEAQKAKEAGKPKAVPSKDPGMVAETTESVVKEAAAEAKRKLKIDDEEIDEDEVISTYKKRKEHQRAAAQILQEGRYARKQAEEFISMMRDPDKFFEVAEKLGHNPRTLAEKKLAAALEEELLSPLEKELREKTRKLETYEQKEKRIEEEAKARAHEELKSKYVKEYNDQFVKALEEVNVPRDRQTVADMAGYIGRYAKKGIAITATEAAMLVKEDLKNKNKALLKDATAEQILELIGDEGIGKVRKWDTSRVRSPEQFLKTPAEQPDPAQARQRSAPKGRMTNSEWRDFNRK
jgi:hypothetical protein